MIANSPPSTSTGNITDDIRNKIARINRAGGAYHRFNFGDDLAIEGDYDMAKYMHHYGLPARLDGLSVLDVGTSSGALAVECARRGAQVTAIDLWDTSEVLQVACAALGVTVHYVQKDIFDTDRSFGQFDFVVCGSMLLHVASPLDAIRRMRALCRGHAVISTSCPHDSQGSDRPLCDFLGVHANDGDYWHYWAISAAALRKMLLAAGFAAVGEPRHFVLQTEPGRVEYVSPHVVVSASV